MPNVIKQIVKAGEYGTQTIKMIVRSNERGPQGKQGEQGVQGPQGIPGPRGFDGAIQYRAGTGIKITDDNIIEATGESTAAWGGIQGNIQDQTDLQNEFSQYVKPADLATVATTGDYDDLTDKPTIPTVNDATLTIQSDGTTVGTFTANSATNVTANVIPPVRVGSVISQPTDVAFVDTVNIVDGAVTADKVNFASLVPGSLVTDYGQITSTTTITPSVDGYLVGKSVVFKTQASAAGGCYVTDSSTIPLAGIPYAEVAKGPSDANLQVAWTLPVVAGVSYTLIVSGDGSFEWVNLRSMGTSA